MFFSKNSAGTEKQHGPFGEDTLIAMGVEGYVLGFKGYSSSFLHGLGVVSRSQTLYLPLPEIRVWWTEQGKLVFTPQDKRGYLSPPLSVCGWSLCKRCK